MYPVAGADGDFDPVRHQRCQLPQSLRTSGRKWEKNRWCPSLKGILFDCWQRARFFKHDVSIRAGDAKRGDAGNAGSLVLRERDHLTRDDQRELRRAEQGIGAKRWRLGGITR